MTPRERAVLLLTSCLGDPERKILTPVQFRILQQRGGDLQALTEQSLRLLGLERPLIQRILALSAEQERLDGYLRLAGKQGCTPLTVASAAYPKRAAERLGLDAPGTLWTKGDRRILDRPAVALVGSRELQQQNRAFAREVGRTAAELGCVLVSGNARGADREAQQAALQAGGQVISVVADALAEQPADPNILYLSEDGFDLAFSAIRALSRNRVIHALGCCTFVAQSHYGQGGTWDGTLKNLKNLWSPVYCFDDGSVACCEFQFRGAVPISIQEIRRTIHEQSR